MSLEEYSEFIQYLKEVMQGIESSKDCKKVAAYKVGLA
jgi:hypothetical protein